ncbi:hypothetical protein P9112_011197 [Eukaryota sp. TZLM1-RC]
MVLTHILRSTSPSISHEFCRIFNELRTKFLANLLDIDSSFLRSHIFCSTELGGLDFHKSKYLCKAAFIGRGKNFVFEFLKRFPENQHLIEYCVSDYLVSLQSEIECISPQIWSKCFPADIQEIPPRSLISLKFAYAKLQKKILKVFESLDFTVRLILAKEKNPVFANFLIDLKDSSSSCLISQIPNVYGHTESFVEPLLRSLDINESVRDSEYGKRRADVVVPSFDDVMNVVDVVIVDVCKKNALKNAQSEVSPLDDSELYKRKKYANPLKELKHVCCRSFNSLRTEFFADLLDVEPGMLKSHLFSSANLGGIGFINVFIKFAHLMKLTHN